MIEEMILQSDLKLGKIIAIYWHIDDVKAVRPELTDEQASLVLRDLKRNHDAEIGINWETIEVVADILFPEADDAVTQGGAEHD